ncbi:type III secretion system chaperone [Pleionea sediminis]|uniref:type III secretion system chaperone n=1 Tax=Pleionea sediminis TaxID=2569479 RepID=UPI001185D8DA|nr:type III secretion system chaperone [Pleionea sediminis]
MLDTDDNKKDIDRDDSLDVFLSLMNDLFKVLNIDSEVVSDAVELQWNGRSLSLYLGKNGFGQDELIVKYPLGTVESGVEHDIYPMLLEGNYLWSATDGGTLALDSQQRSVFLCHSVKLRTLNPSALIEFIERIHSTAFAWQELITSKNQQANKKKLLYRESQNLLKV